MRKQRAAATHTYPYTRNRQVSVVVRKSKFTLSVLPRRTTRGRELGLPAKFKIGIGRNRDMDPKQHEGDNRTPEGVYYVCQKAVTRPGKRGTRWMRLTFPNLRDIARAREAGIVDSSTGKKLRRAYRTDKFSRIETPVGFGIGIHGTNEPRSIGKCGSDGCIRMRNCDVEALFDLVPLGTRVEILS